MRRNGLGSCLNGRRWPNGGPRSASIDHGRDRPGRTLPWRECTSGARISPITYLDGGVAQHATYKVTADPRPHRGGQPCRVSGVRAREQFGGRRARRMSPGRSLSSRPSPGRITRRKTETRSNRATAHSSRTPAMPTTERCRRRPAARPSRVRSQASRASAASTTSRRSASE